MANCWKNLFYAGGAIFLLIFVYQVLLTTEGGQVGLLGASIVSFFATRIADVIKFKLSLTSLEAEMRATLEDAKATIKQLHLLAGGFAKLTLQTIQAEGRLGGGLSPKVKTKMRENILTTLKNLEMDDSEIKAITDVELPFIHFDYSNYVTRKLSGNLPTEKAQKWSEFFSPNRRKGLGYEPSPDELEDFLRSIDFLDDETKERLADYRHYHQHHTHRRPAEWENRHNMD